MSSLSLSPISSTSSLGTQNAAPQYTTTVNATISDAIGAYKKTITPNTVGENIENIAGTIYTPQQQTVPTVVKLYVKFEQDTDGSIKVAEKYHVDDKGVVIKVE